MRKFLLSLSMLLLFVSAIYAHNSNQKIYDYDNIEYQEVKVLTSIAGVIGPSSATPVNSNELLLALDRIDINTLSADSRTKYISLYDKLSNGNENFQFNYNISIAPQVFLSYDQSGRKDIIRDRRDFFIPYSQEIPSMAAELEFIYGNNAYITPQATLDDGLLDVTILEPFTILDVPTLAFQLFHKTINQNSRIKTFRCQKLNIHRNKPGVVHYDGDPVVMGVDIEVKIVKKELRVIVPQNAEHDTPNVFQRAQDYINGLKQLNKMYLQKMNEEWKEREMPWFWKSDENKIEK